MIGPSAFGLSKPGAAGNKKAILKIGDAAAGDQRSHVSTVAGVMAGQSGCRTVDVYISLNEGQVYPTGLSAGTGVQLTWLYVRKTRKTGRLYCVSTPLTAIGIRRMAACAVPLWWVSSAFHLFNLPAAHVVEFPVTTAGPVLCLSIYCRLRYFTGVYQTSLDWIKRGHLREATTEFRRRPLHETSGPVRQKMISSSFRSFSDLI